MSWSKLVIYRKRPPSSEGFFSGNRVKRDKNMAIVDSELRAEQNRDVLRDNQSSGNSVITLPGCVTADFGNGKMIIAPTLEDVRFCAGITRFRGFPEFYSSGEVWKRDGHEKSTDLVE